MPPNWQDVQWDHANAAAKSLRDAADELDRSAGDRSRAAQPAQQEWRGQHRTTFDNDLAAILGNSQQIAKDYRDAAQRIDSASDKATTEQQRRERERSEYREQQRQQRQGGPQME